MWDTTVSGWESRENESSNHHHHSFMIHTYMRLARWDMKTLLRCCINVLACFDITNSIDFVIWG